MNPEKRLSSPLFNLQGLDAAAMARPARPAKRQGRRPSRTSTTSAPGEIYVNESAAEELDVKAGDTIMLYVSDGSDAPSRVKAIVEDRRLAGAGGISVRREGGVLPLATAQAIFDAPGQPDADRRLEQGRRARRRSPTRAMSRQTLDAALIAQPRRQERPRSPSRR